MMEVTAAVIRRGDRFLICQRPRDKYCGLLWEFPGGKIEPGETAEDCVVRECREELGVTLRVVGQRFDVVQEHPDRVVHLRFFDAEIVSGTLTPLEHAAVAWVTAEEAKAYEFCPADARMLAEAPPLPQEKGGTGMEEIRPGRYRHFKGNEYEVLFVARHSETEAPMVVYRALYGERGLWVRPASMWNETVERDGKVFRRFTFIGAALPEKPAEPTQEARVAYYEAILDRAEDAAARLDAPLEAFAALQPRVRELDAYYGGADWRRDLADDEAGRLPAGLKRGVLSEDGAYDALAENRRLLGRMAEISAEAREDGVC